MFQELYDALETLDYEPRSYSGRSMYGKQCLGVMLESDQELWSLAQALTRDGIEIEAPKTDSFGRGIVIYWPSIKWEPVEASDED